MAEKGIKVLLLTTSFPLRQGDKSGIFIWQMIRYLPPHVNITVLTPTAPDIEAHMHHNENFRLHCFSYAPRRWQVLAHQPGGIPFILKHDKRLLFLLPLLLGSMFWNCFRLARDHDLIHANWSINGLIAGCVGMILKKPVITTLRGSDMQRAQSGKVDYFLLKLCVRVSNKVTAVSETIKNILIEQFPGHRDKIVTISNGIGQQFLEVERKNQEHSPVIFTTAGSLTPQKGMHIILQAMGIIKNKFDVKLNLLGDGPDMDTLRSLARELGIHEKVSFFGDVPHSQMPSYLEAGHVFILASFSEGRPNVILEAMATGMPIIASDIAGVKELISDSETGLLFKTGDAQDLASQMEHVVHDIDLQKKIGQAAKRYILDNKLLMSRTAAQYQKLYEDCIR